MTNSLFDIKEKIVLITGSTHGLGMAMAKGMGQVGATIIINGNSSQQKIDNAVKELNQEGIHALGYKFNVTDEKEVITAIQNIQNEVGPIDILINNAGIIKRLSEAILNQYDGIRIYDNIGKLVISNDAISEEINLSSLKSGLYIIKFKKGNTYSKGLKMIKK